MGYIIFRIFKCRWIFRRFNLDKIDYLKIDCEGSELPFLLNKDLSNVDYIGMEIHFISFPSYIELMEYMLIFFNLTARVGRNIFQYKNKKI